MTLPQQQAFEANCPSCETIKMEIIKATSLPTMTGYKSVVLQRCPKCGAEVTITTTIDMEKPIVPKRKVGLYIPKGVKLPEGYETK